MPPLKKIANYGGLTATTAVREPQAIGKDFQATGLELQFLKLQLCLIKVRGATNRHFVNVNVNVTYRAGGCPVTKQRTRGVGQRSCYGNYGKLVRKVGNAVVFPIYIMPKNQSLSCDQEFTTLSSTQCRHRSKGCSNTRDYINKN